MFAIGAAAADIVDDDDRSANASDHGTNDATLPEKNANESNDHKQRTNRTSTSSDESTSKPLGVMHNTHPPLKRTLQAKPALIPKFSIGQISINSAHSVISTNYGEHIQLGRWIDDKTAW